MGGGWNASRVPDPRRRRSADIARSGAPGPSAKSAWRRRRRLGSCSSTTSPRRAPRSPAAPVCFWPEGARKSPLSRSPGRSVAEYHRATPKSRRTDAHPPARPRRRHRGRRALLTCGEEAREGGQAGLAPGRAHYRAEGGARSRREPGRRGDAPAQGNDAPRVRALDRHGALREPRGGRPRPPGQEAPRQAPRQARGAQGGSPGTGRLTRARGPGAPCYRCSDMSILDRALRVGEGKKFKAFERNVELINAFEPELELESDEELRQRYADLRERHLNGAPLEELLYESFALTREAGKRALGQRPFDVQLIGGMVLHDGSIAEMKTGEGKTLTATLPVVLNALASRDEDGHAVRGQGIHLVTVNDYLARRDAQWMKPIYDLLGVTVGILQSGQNEIDKQEAYSRDVVYGTNSEFGFDYLRDNLAVEMEQKAQRGHGFAIVDEVDNILIDEARTPLIISGQPEQAADLYYKFAKLARIMEVGEKPDTLEAKSKEWEADYDFEADEKHKTVSVTERGVAKAEKFLGIDNLYRAEYGNLVNHLQQALKAEELYKKDVDYAVIDGEVKIIDEFTGRILEGRRWSEGLHQAVEAKEGVAIQEESQTVATITYQNSFRRYEKLAGMTGTALTEATEFMKIYDLQVVEIPTNRPMIRDDRNDQIYKTKDGKWAAVKHAVLNAKPEHAEREGEVIAEAGRPFAVTIATNMAGRGVDIKLGGNEEHLTQLELRRRAIEPGSDDWNEAWDEVFPQMEAKVAEGREKVTQAGGLFICGTERHESRRIDNQLRGRSGRQGDPGASRFFLSAEDDLIRIFAGDRIYKILDRLGPGEDLPIEAKMLTKTVEGAQKKVEEQNFNIRKRVLEYDDVLNKQREVVYSERRRVLEGEDLGEQARDWIAETLVELVDQYGDEDSLP